MAQLKLIIVALLANVCSACATKSETTGSLAKDAAINMRMNSPAGKYEVVYGRLGSKLNKSPEGLITIARIVRVQPSDKWLSTFAHCVSGEAPLPELCLLFAQHHGENHFRAAVVYRHSDAALTKQKDIAVRARPGESLRLITATSDTNVTFSINGQEVHSGNLAVTPVSYSYACASAICEFSNFDVTR